ncbi:MAG: hypothetical protein OZ921_15350 [Sorangiineae bacterium]|nr:hypothetical protein [Polyangiaceae bacterium]MEB2323887.1 hypothetical protein [Sorangiineae bacterium]
MPEPLIALRLDAEDRALLEACVRTEKLTKSDILRRALRLYARELGVTPEAPTAGKRQRRKR